MFFSIIYFINKEKNIKKNIIADMEPCNLPDPKPAFVERLIDPGYELYEDETEVENDGLMAAAILASLEKPVVMTQKQKMDRARDSFIKKVVENSKKDKSAQ